MGARSDIFVCTTARSYPQITHTAQYCLGLLTGNRPGLLYAMYQRWHWPFFPRNSISLSRDIISYTIKEMNVEGI